MTAAALDRAFDEAAERSALLGGVDEDSDGGRSGPAEGVATVCLRLPTMDSLDDVGDGDGDLPANAGRQHSAASEYAFGRISAATSEASRGSRPRRAAPAGGGARSRSGSGSVADSDDTSTMSCSMPEGWRRYTTPDGRPYFFNPAAGGGTQWEPPVLRYVTDDGRAYSHDP